MVFFSIYVGNWFQVIPCLTSFTFNLTVGGQVECRHAMTKDTECLPHVSSIVANEAIIHSILRAGCVAAHPGKNIFKIFLTFSPLHAKLS